MKIYLNKNVYEAALERINRLFDEFPNVVVSFSGGKDSAVILNLCLKIAEERGRLPLSVMWIDQEAEWQATADYAKKVMEDPRVKPYWFQMPMVITNNASSSERYHYCWKEGEPWLREKHPLSIKENKYDEIRFHRLFEKIFKVEFPNTKSCFVAGVRGEESPKRAMSLTSSLCYKDITWGKRLNVKLGHYTFYPIYDWSYTDVWHYLHVTGCEYNTIYDSLYTLGVPPINMRVSNLHHETAIQSLLLIQEIEPDTWNKIAKLIPGANTIKHLNKQSFTCPADLPPMFKDWEEFAIYLKDNIIQEEKNKRLIEKNIATLSKIYTDDFINISLYKTIINTILSSDWDLTKLTN